MAMEGEPGSPHDAVCRHFFGSPENAASELRALLPEAFVAQVDWSTLTLMPSGFVSDHLKSRYGDLLFSVRVDGRLAFIYCLIEHQSRSDRWMALRLTEYMVNIWRQYLRDNAESEVLPMIVPLVVYAHPKGRRWRAATDLSELFALSAELRESLGDLVPRMRYVVDDVGAVDLVELRKRSLTPAALVVLRALQVASREDVVESLYSLVDDLAAMYHGPNGQGYLTAVMTYIGCVSDVEPERFDPLLDRLEPQVREAVVTTLEKLVAKNVARGEVRGEARGEVRGKADSLLRLLGCKFGDVPGSVSTRVRSASIAELDRWTERILTATTIEEVLVRDDG
ncbi:Rpn family recombination-promoting nuclease/putative transposase [Nocardia sp. NPDC059177]|uniref:Rpn family recombination-promoting nuclease/putative transposase n=1 Tax=Nocardia sp. NPDC059177 TaxID=3346759 RepID=UPI0036B0484B